MSRATAARCLSHGQSNRHGAVLQAAKPLPREQPEQGGLREKGENPHREAGREAVRTQKGPSLSPLVRLDSDDLRHTLVDDPAGGGIDRSRIAPAGEYRAEVVGG